MSSQEFTDFDDKIEQKMVDEIQTDDKWDELNFDSEQKDTKEKFFKSSTVTRPKQKKASKKEKNVKKVFKIKTQTNFDVETRLNIQDKAAETLYEPKMSKVDDEYESDQVEKQVNFERTEKRLVSKEDHRVHIKADDEENESEEDREKEKKKKEEEVRQKQEELEELRRKKKAEEKRLKEEEERIRLRKLEEERIKLELEIQQMKENSILKAQHQKVEAKEAEVVPMNNLFGGSSIADTKREVANKDNLEIEDVSLVSEDEQAPVEDPKVSVEIKPEQEKPKVEITASKRNIELPKKLSKREYLKDFFDETSNDILYSKKRLALNDQFMKLYKPIYDKLNTSVKFLPMFSIDAEELENECNNILASVSKGSLSVVRLLVETPVRITDMINSPLSTFFPNNLDFVNLTEQKKEEMQTNFEYVRSPLNDGNSFFRCVYLGLIEIIIFNRKQDRIHKLVYGINQIKYNKEWETQKTQLMAVLCYLLESLGTVDDVVLYCNFMKLVHLLDGLDTVSY